MSRENYEEIVRYFVSMVDQIPESRWGDHGLGEWSLRDLVGHASRAMLTVDMYTNKPSQKSVTGYNVTATNNDPNEVAKSVVERGREAGKALGEEPSVAVREIAERVLAKLPTVPDDFPVETPFGTVLFGDYLPTRVLELTIHSLDIARAAGLEVTAPERPMVETLDTLGRTAVRRGNGPTVALALTGRAPLPADFSLVLGGAR